MGEGESKSKVVKNQLIDISDLNNLVVSSTLSLNSSHIIPILVIGETGSGKSSFLNYLMFQYDIDKSSSCKISSDLEGTQNIQCYQIENLLLIDTQGFEYDSSMNYQQQPSIYFQFLNQLSQVSKLIFFIQDGIRDCIPFQIFLQNLQNLGLIQSKIIYYVKNKLNENSIVQLNSNQNQQYQMLFSLMNLKGNIQSVSQNVNNPKMQFNLKNIIKTRNCRLDIPKNQFLNYLNQIVNYWNQLRLNQPFQGPQPQQQNNQSYKKKSKTLCMFQQDEKNKYKLFYDKELFDEVLSNFVCSDKIKTVICCGKTGVGKSFFLTELCKQFGQNDIIFDYESSSEQKTIGIQYHRFKDKDDYDVFLMDCQGFDYYDGDLNGEQQIELQKQLKFLISLFSKGFQYFIFMQTGMRSSQELNHIKKLMSMNAISFIQPQILIIKNKLIYEEVDKFQQYHKQINNSNEQYLPLIYQQNQSKSMKIFNKQMEKIYKNLKNEKVSKNQFYNFYEVVEYIQLSISIFNGEIDKQLQNILEILKLRFTFSQEIRAKNNIFLENMKISIEKQKKNYQNQYDVFFFCSKNILYSAFQDQQLELIKTNYISLNQQWDSKLNSLLSTLEFESEDSKNQILSKYAQLDKVAPELIQCIKQFQINQDYNQLKLIFTTILTGGIGTASIVLGISAGFSASAAATAAIEASAFAAVGLSGMAITAITLGASAGIFLLAGMYYGGKQYFKFKKNKIQKQKSLKLLENLREQKIFYQEGKFDKAASLQQSINQNFKPESEDVLARFVQNKQGNENFFGLLLVTFMLIDNSSQDFDKMSKILQNKKNKFINVFKKADSLLSELGKKNVQNICEIYFDKLYSLDFSDIKEKNFVIDENDLGNVLIQSFKCSDNFEKIPNYREHQSLYNCLALLRAQSKLFIISFMFKHLVESNTRFFSKFIFEEFNAMLNIVNTILKNTS
ncbi:hypothetical protein ABPG72_011573 [Tetrahymena utriculariae]